MRFRPQVTCLAFLVCSEFVATGCINSDPVDEMPIPSTMTSTTVPSASASASSMEPVDTTGCGVAMGEITADVQISPNCLTAAAVNCNVVSFEPGTYTEGMDVAHWKDTWQDTGSLSGGVHMYTTEGATPPATPLTRVMETGALHATGTILKGQYAGIVFWFGPCQDVTPFEGVQFTASGTLNTATFAVQVQTDANYPIDTENTKGGCAFVDEATKWDTCKYNTYLVPSLPAADAFSYYLPFEQFTGGLPETTVSKNQLVGIQFHMECPSDGVADCPIDVLLHDLRFYRGHAAALTP